MSAEVTSERVEGESGEVLGKENNNYVKIIFAEKEN